MPSRSEILRDYYENRYDRVHENAFGKIFTGYTHKTLEARRDRHFSLILELGCGKGNHLKFIRSSYDRLVMTDITDRFSNQQVKAKIAEGRVPEEAGRYFSLADAKKLKYSDNLFDRIIVTCLLLHFADPVPVLNEWIRVLKVGGVVDVLVPNDLGIFVRVYQTLISNPKAKKLGIENLEYIRAIDHQSSPKRTLSLVQKEIEHRASVEIESYPFPKIKKWKPKAFWILRVQKLST